MVSAWSAVAVCRRLSMMPGKSIGIGAFVCVFCFVWCWAFVMTVAHDRARRTMCRSLSFVGLCGSGLRFCGVGNGGIFAILSLCCDEGSGADLRREY